MQTARLCGEEEKTEKKYYNNNRGNGKDQRTKENPGASVRCLTLTDENVFVGQITKCMQIVFTVIRVKGNNEAEICQSNEDPHVKQQETGGCKPAKKESEETESDCY